MNRQKLLPVLVALVSMVAGIILFQLFDKAEELAAGDDTVQLDRIPLHPLDGETMSIGDLKPDVLVVNFWAPWCVPCRREIPALISINDSYQSRGLTIVGIALDGEQAVRDFAAEYGIDYPLFLAGNGIAMYNAAFGNPSGALPFTAILDREQQIVFQHNGEVTEQQLIEQLEAVM